MSEEGIDDTSRRFAPVADDAASCRRRILSNSTKSRIAELKLVNEQLQSSDLPATVDISDTLDALFDTHFFYTDVQSRRAAEQCIATALAASHLRPLVQSIIDRTLDLANHSVAPGSALVLLRWCSIYLQQYARDPNLWTANGRKTIRALAQLLCNLHGLRARNSTIESANRALWRGLRSLLRSDHAEAALADAVDVLASKSTAVAPENALVLGAIAGVLDRLPNRDALNRHKTTYNDFVVRELLGSRQSLPMYIPDGLRDYMRSYVADEDLSAKFVPAIEKALLRSPEIVLDNVLPSLIGSLSPTLDLSVILSSHLLKPLLASVKSTNTTIRANTIRTFELVSARCFDEATVDRVAIEIVTPLAQGKLPSADHRAACAHLLRMLPRSKALAQKIPDLLSPLAVKETNESAAAVEITVLSLHLAHGLEVGVTPSKLTVDNLLKGLAEKKLPFRRLWTLGVAEILWQQESTTIFAAHALSFVDILSGKLIENWQEVQNVAAGAMTVDQVAATCATIAVCLGHVQSTLCVKRVLAASMAERSTEVTPKISTLLNPRLYSKLSDPQDQIWFLRALKSIANLSIADSQSLDVKTAWAHALIFLLVSAQTTPAIRREARSQLTTHYRADPLLTIKAVTAGLRMWCVDSLSDNKDSAAVASKSGRNSLYLVVQCLCRDSTSESANGRIPQDVLDEQHLDLLTLCRPQLIPRANWIELCLATGTDPGALVERHPQQCLKRIMEPYADATLARIGNFTTAACNAAADLAFVAPKTCLPMLVTHIKADLDFQSLRDIGPTEAAIYRTAPGSMFVDILAKQAPAPAPSKGSKDYDTLKWEADLRRQLAQKQGSAKKLTAEENAKVTAQLTKEAAVRQTVARLVSRLRRGIGLVSALITGPPTETETWFGFCSQSLIDVINADVGMLLGGTAVSTYLQLATKTSIRLGPLRTFVGVATLRAANAPSIPQNMTKEPLGDLVTRLLYRLRFMGEQRPLDAVTLAYVLPLMFLVLGNGGIGKDGEDADEQIVLAGEFLAFHMSVCADLRLPRERILSAIIAAMQVHTQHFRLFKDSLNDLCRSIAVNLTNEEADVLVRATINPQTAVRTAVLQVINAELELTFKPFYEEIWIACHDDLEENIDIAQEIWEENDLSATPDTFELLQPYLYSHDSQLRRAAARAFADIVRLHPESFPVLLSRMQELYIDTSKVQSVVKDKYGMPLKTQPEDPWAARHGIGLTFKEMTQSFTFDLIVPFLQFMVIQGPLGDSKSNVQEAMLDAAVTVVTVKASEQVTELMNIFEAQLSRKSASAQEDLVNEAVVILYGALARHLKHGDSQITKVVQRLLDTLSTPSESVQYAVSQCLPPLVQASHAQAGDYARQMTELVLHGKTYAARRGAAYGLAGIVKGRGLLALREFRILPTLADAGANKTEPIQREGSFLAYELLSFILGRVFEPYIIQIVPNLLVGFGDTSADVRQACLDAAKTCFASLSSFGVKQILPMLLEGLDDHQWRSKKGACDSLGAMAYLDPRQLAVSLPEIIPPLTEVLNDSHKEVRASANRSLQRFGDVISNPEIKSQVQILLKALSDPTKFTDDALDALIKVNFVHYLDAPSLALVVRVLERGLGDRSVTKRKSSQIIGSLAHLTDRKDLIAHLPVLVAGLRVAIVDAVPATRATASKALGSAVEKLGEDVLPDLIPSLMATLKSDTGAGDRLGSAQALSEVLAGLGTRRLEETLPTILQNVSSSKASVREGFMSLFIYLPVTFGNSFSNYLSSIIPPILAGLADEVESIRETALRAGRLLVKNFATRAVDLLLPELERGLADDSHRIRLSSVELVGELLFNLTGITAQSEQEETEASQSTGQTLLEVLGEEKRNKILSALYICRNDTSGLVKAAAVEVWKALVSTPRTLRELVPTLTQLLIRRLASNNPEQKEISGNALGELIRKAGESVLATLLPTLEEGLQTSTDTDARQGICIALRELMAAASTDGLAEYEKTLISVVRTALVDSSADVREAAAEAFDSMQKVFGKKAIDQVLPHLLSMLQSSEDAENSLSALLTLLTDQTRSNVILPNLLPTLLAKPISAFNARAMASLAGVARSAMTRRLPVMLNALLDGAVECEDAELRAELDGAFESVLLSVDEYDGLNTAMSVMIGLVKHDEHLKRAAAEIYLASFFAKTTVDFSRYYPDLIRVLLNAFEDGDLDVVKAAWTALNALTSRLRKEEMESLVMSTRQVLGHVGASGQNLPGFCLPKGIGAILPIFLQGLMNGTTEQRTQAALAISDVVDRTSADSLKPFVTQITGPLIRILSERSVDVKAAILFTLNNLLVKIPLMLKPFLPQLQRTFAKSLADPTSEVLRSRAAKALGTLITLTPRVDPLIAELVTGCKTPDVGVREAMMSALFEVVSKAGNLMNDASKDAILGLIDSDTNNGNEKAVTTNARLLGSLVKVLPAETSGALIKNRVLTSNPTFASLLALNAILVASPDSLTKPFEDALALTIENAMAQATSPLPETSILAAGKYLLLYNQNPQPSAKTTGHVDTLLGKLATIIEPRSGKSIDCRRLALVVLRTVVRHHSETTYDTTIAPRLETLVPPVFASVRDPVIPIKLAAEQAFLALFKVVDVDGELFDEYVARVTEQGRMDAAAKRSMGDYFKRVALRLGAQARERREAEGGSGALGLASDEVEDEKEVWSVGRSEIDSFKWE